MGLLRETAMLRNKSIKSVITAITFGAMVSAGTYFFMPPPSSSYACDKREIGHVVREVVADCINGGYLTAAQSGIYSYEISTFC